MVDRLLLRIVIILLSPLGLLPLSAGRRVGRLLGWIAGMPGSPLRRKVIANVREAWEGLLTLNPSLSASSPARVTSSFFRHLGMFVVEVVRIAQGDERFLDQVEFRGVEHYREAKERGRGILFITAHCGNWEASALAFARRFEPFSVVVRHQRSAAVTSFLESVRNRSGNETVMKRGAAKRILSLVRQGRIVGILSDIAVEEKDGILVPFLGKPAWTTSLPAVIARKTGCALLPGFIHRDGERLVVTFHPEIPVEEESDAAITEAISNVIERHIAGHPAEWFWFYHRWRRAPDSLESAGATGQ